MIPQEYKQELDTFLLERGFEKTANEDFTWYSRELFQGVPVVFTLKNHENVPKNYVCDCITINRTTADLFFETPIKFQEGAYIGLSIAQCLEKLIGQLIYEMLFAFEEGKTLDEMFTEEETAD